MVEIPFCAPENLSAWLCGDLLFWRLEDVTKRVGLSRSEIYRRQKDTDPALNPFPRSRRYKGDERKGVFYLSTDIRAWQLRELGIDPDAVLSLAPVPAPIDVAKLLG